jgi:hypothetical protein
VDKRSLENRCSRLKTEIFMIMYKQTSASELYRPSDRRLSEKLLPTFADRGYRVVSTTDPHGLFSVFYAGAVIISSK